MRHTPGNIVGPLLIFLATGGAMGITRSDADLTFHLVVSNVGVAIYWISVILFLLYFPDGKPYFRCIGKWVGRIIFLLLLLAFILEIVTSPTLVYGTISGSTPLYIPGLKPFVDALQGLLSLFGAVYMPFVLVSLIARY